MADTPPLKSKPNRPAEFAPRPPEAEIGDSMSGITIACRRFDYHGNGTITLWFPSVPLKEEHRKALHELYPNLLDKAHDLLGKENLLAQMDQVDSQAPAYEDKISLPPNNRY